MLHVGIMNASTVIANAQLLPVLAALQVQVSRDFAPAWGVDAKLRLLGKDEHAAPGEWLLALLDDADQSDALGYHETNARGMPIGKVFARTTIATGDKWSVTLSHELLELLADPWIVSCVVDERTQRIYSLEVCDAVEKDLLGYTIQGVNVSDFVLPAFFERDISTHAPLSFCGHVHRPFEIAGGGYMSFIDLKAPHRGWQSLPAERRREGTNRGAFRRNLLTPVYPTV